MEFIVRQEVCHGLPISTGMAFARKQLKIHGNIYVMISDGECRKVPHGNLS